MIKLTFSTAYSLEARSTKGFSLIELMVALTISIVLIGAVVLTYISSTATARDAETLARMQEDVRVASEFLIRDIRNAGFRDETTLKVGHERALRQNFATIDNESKSISVRYSGLGHCGQQFDKPRVVRNKYYVADGTVDADQKFLWCEGSHLPIDASGVATNNGSDFESSFAFEEPVSVKLLGGVRSLSVSRVCADGNICGHNDCSFDFDNLDQACVGVEISLGLEALDGEEKTVVFLAAFRNVILERLNEPPPPEPPQN